MRQQYLVASALSTLLCCSVTAQQRPKTAVLSVNYFTCTDAGSWLVALTDADRAKTATCDTWDNVTARQPVALAKLNLNKRYARSAAFLRDVVRIAYAQDDVSPLPPGFSLPRHLSASGFVELPAPTFGAFISDGDIIGVIINKLASSVRTDPPARAAVLTKQSLRGVRVLYPSPRAGGALRIASAARVVKPGKSRIFTTAKNIPPKPRTTQIPLSWNAWFEIPPSPSFEPITRLDPGARYSLVVDLAGLRYNLIADPTAGNETTAWITTWIDRSKASATSLSVVAIPDQAFFRSPVVRAPMTVDLNAIRRWTHTTTSYASDPLQALRADDTPPPFVFGRVTVPIDTGSREGNTSVTITAWDDTGRPLEALRVPVCVATPEHVDDCHLTKPSSEPAQGFGPARLTPNASPQADALLALVDTGNGVTGLFQASRKEALFDWRVADDTRLLIEQLRRFTRAFSDESTDAEVQHIGELLLLTLFPASEDALDSRSIHARDAFEKFLRDAALAHEPPIIATAYLATDTPPALPLGLLNTPNTDGTPTYLGFVTRIEAPLPRYTTGAPPRCIQRWAIVVPPITSNDLNTVRAAFDEQMSPWCGLADRFFESMTDFKAWVWLEAREKQQIALFVLSHYGDGTLYYTASDAMLAVDIRRSFIDPSVAILNGCGTGGDGDGVVGHLNRRGVQTVIATTHSITPQLASDYLTCLATTLPRTADAPAPALRDTHLAVLRCLRDRKDLVTNTPWGARALAYALLGNSDVRLCAPGK